ncbi:hypothetical protein, partial [Pseudomonas syringae]|uniref:hypothetical protein n=1 Tax=Pseudomonas syringae TaxID=317 RepID=UPI0019595386
TVREQARSHALRAEAPFLGSVQRVSLRPLHQPQNAWKQLDRGDTQILPAGRRSELVRELPGTGSQTSDLGCA